MNGNDDIAVIADRLPSGGQLSGELCPKCRGGLAGDRSLSIQKEGASVQWYCHRAGCGFRGRIGARISYSDAPPRDKTPPQLPELVELPKRILAYLEERYRIEPEAALEQGWAWTTWAGGALAMPVRNRWWACVGYMLRTLSKPKRCKLIMQTIGAESLSYYPSPAEGEDTLVVVEDQLSALRVSKFVDCVALLGTNLSEGKVVDLTKTGIGHIILALDADAYGKAVGYVPKYGPFFKRLSAVKLEKDFKDCSDKEIQLALRGVDE